jgi:hypothetical protein
VNENNLARIRTDHEVMSWLRSLLPAKRRAVPIRIGSSVPSRAPFAAQIGLRGFVLRRRSGPRRATAPGRDAGSAEPVTAMQVDG